MPQLRPLTPVGLRSGADARAEGTVPQYAQHMKDRLLALGRSERDAEKVRLDIIARFGEGS